MTILDNAIVLYQSPDGSSSLEVRLDHETVWLNQAQLVALFDRDQSVISRHLRNVFNEGELDEKSNMQKMHIANSDKPIVFYNRPEEKETIVKVIVNLTNRKND